MSLLPSPINTPTKYAQTTQTIILNQQIKMNQITFHCIKCRSAFDLDQKSPRILPCSNSICLDCLHQSSRPISGFEVPCSCSDSPHCLNTATELYPSQMITGFLNSQMASTPKLDSLKQQLNSSRFSLNVAKYEADSHYDAMAMDIDIRAETLINLIHDKRAQLLKNVDALRLQTDNDFIELTDLHARQYSRLKENYATIAKKLEVSSSLIEKDLDELMRSFNKIQQSINSVKSGIFQFVANPEECDSGLLGRFLKRENVMFSKIQNLTKLPSIQVQFQSDLTAKIQAHSFLLIMKKKKVKFN